MKVTTRNKQPAPQDDTSFRHRYLNELIDFGGDMMTRAEVIDTMQAEGTPQPMIDRWLQGQELAAETRARHEHLTTTLVLGKVRRRRITR